MNKGISRKKQLELILSAAIETRSDLRKLKNKLRNVLPTRRKRRPLLTVTPPKYAFAVND